jgi:hypothetical protein
MEVEHDADHGQPAAADPLQKGLHAAGGISVNYIDDGCSAVHALADGLFHFFEVRSAALLERARQAVHADPHKIRRRCEPQGPVRVDVHMEEADPSGFDDGVLDFELAVPPEHRLAAGKVQLAKTAQPGILHDGHQPSAPSENVKKAVSSLTNDMDALAIHNALHEFAKANGIEVKVMFSEVYRALIGKERGPRAGKLIAALGVERVKKDLGI